MQKARRRPKAPTACRQQVSGTISLPFSGYFSPFPHGTCSLSVSQHIQPYQMVLADSDRITHVPPYSGYYQVYKTFHVRGFHPLWPTVPSCSIMIYKSILQSYNPITAETVMVWAISISLATTPEITFVFSSCAYLDVSVQRVCPLAGNISSIYWVAPFGNQRIKNYLHLPVAYRSLSRPSSPLRAKAFPVCPQ